MSLNKICFIAAAGIFLLALFGVSLGIDLVILGLLLTALGLAL